MIKTEKKNVIGYVIVAISMICMIYGSLVIGYHMGYECAKADPNLGKFADYDCYDGCLYAEWQIYGYKNLSTSSELYDKCTNACLYGEQVFKGD